ncbi:hypothetical protein GCM10023185_36670 [Hymenobacter saemangeumensis]|uniref:Uncharacterized protein n=1 Tax=Hymenobacter saemangeumensis TaxID=1084522 RepID=A0ABP8IR39_9BACT
MPMLLNVRGPTLKLTVLSKVKFAEPVKLTPDKLDHCKALLKYHSCLLPPKILLINPSPSAELKTTFNPGSASVPKPIPIMNSGSDIVPVTWAKKEAFFNSTYEPSNVPNSTTCSWGK